MKFIRIQAKGCFNSFRRSDYQTYHKTFPLPLKTTVGGMIGSALGISPDKVNDEWLKDNRFEMGVIGKSGGKVKDLWQIRKYEGKQISGYKSGKFDTPYKTAVIIRELLYSVDFVIYLSFKNDDDYDLVFEKLKNPVWALSLGREDELIKIHSIDIITIKEASDLYYSNTILPMDLSSTDYGIKMDDIGMINILNEAPQVIKATTSFKYDENTQERSISSQSVFSFVSRIPIMVYGTGYYDDELKNSFEIF